jgi:two-component system sensor histidine kinase DesK
MARPTELSEQHGWVKYVWLIYLSFFIFAPSQARASWPVLIAGGLAIPVFLFLYFSIFRTSGWRQYSAIVAIALLGFGFMPFNSGAPAFIIYAAAFIGFAADFKPGVISLTVLLVLTALEMEWLGVAFYAEASVLLMTALIGLANIYFGQYARTRERLKKADEEIKRLAEVAERERIARDLHDVLGHTLSLIVLKSELASRLIDSDHARAAKEIQDIEDVSRRALAEVRLAISGYRSGDLAAELTRAIDTLKTAGIEVDAEWAETTASPQMQNVLALALREAVLNVVRHSRARRCRLRLVANNGVCSLEVHDDGEGARNPEGNGLRGMRERVEAIGGVLQKTVNQGTLLTITVPTGSRP